MSETEGLLDFGPLPQMVDGRTPDQLWADGDDHWPDGKPYVPPHLAGRIGKGANLSDCGRYRYTLIRTWGDGPRVVFVMLNPSTADASQDDPTIRKCIGFARRWGFGGLTVVNLYAWRSTESKGIGTRAEHVGPENDGFIRAATLATAKAVCAWGPKPKIAGRVRDVLAMLRREGTATYRIGPAAKDGSPCHPLMLAYSRQLELMQVTS